MPTGKVLPKARGGRSAGRETALIGEGRGPEYRIDSDTGLGYVAHGPQLADLNAGDYVIPLEDRFRGRALDLFWMLARDLGVSTYAKGKKGKGKGKGKPKRKVPPPSTFLRLDPEDFDSERDRLKQRLDRLETDAKGGNKSAQSKIPGARRAFEKADAIAKKANQHKRAIEKQDELAEIFRNDMQIADNRDDQRAFDTAKGRRAGALREARRLLKMALKYAKPGSKWERAIRQRIGQATLDIDDTKTSGVDIEGAGDLLTPAEQGRADELDAALALAELTEAIDGPGEDRDILSQIVQFREGVLGRVRSGGSNAQIAEAARAVKDARDQLAGLRPGENLQAQIDQANERARIAEEGQRIAEGSLRVLDGITNVNRIGQAGAGPNITIQTLHPGDSRTLDAIGRAATAGQGMQGARRSPREVLGV